MKPHTFPLATRPISGEGSPAHLMAKAVCRVCDRITWKAVNSPGYAGKVFVASGWLLGPNRARDVCPGCRNQKQKRPDLTPAQRRAAYVRIEAEAAAQVVVAAEPEEEEAAEPPFNTTLADQLAPIAAAMRGDEMPTDPAPKALPPRVPTRDDNRRILEGMDAHYDVERSHYRESFTDESVAAKLKVPRAWVTEVREKFYGPDANEAADIARAKIDVAIGLAEAGVSRLTDMAIEADKILRDLKAGREKLG